MKDKTNTQSPVPAIHAEVVFHSSHIASIFKQSGLTLSKSSSEGSTGLSLTVGNLCSTQH